VSNPCCHCRVILYTLTSVPDRQSSPNDRRYHRLRPLPRSPVRCCSPVGRSSGVFDLSNPNMDSGRIRRNRPPFSARIRIRESSFDAADPLAKPEVLGGRMTSRRPASTTQTNNDDVTLDHVHQSRQFDLPLNHRVQTSPSPIHYETESGLGRIEYGTKYYSSRCRIRAALVESLCIRLFVAVTCKYDVIQKPDVITYHSRERKCAENYNK